MSSGIDPWSLIASMIVGSASRNMKQSGEGAESAEKGGYGPRQGGMVYQAAPNMGNTAVSPTAQIMQVGAGMPADFQKQAPGVGEALKGEEQMLRNVTPAQGAYYQAPTDYHSNSPFSLAYMKYLKYPIYSSARY